jgi:phosphoglycerate dehydrogenase-like enzyme
MNPADRSPFHLRLTADFYDAAGQPKFADLGLGVFQHSPYLRVSAFPEHHAVIQPDQLAGCHAALVLSPRVTAKSLQDAHDLLLIARFGVGFDNVDVDACTERDVLVSITSGAVDRPVAEATLGWMIALSHHMLVKDRLVRTGQWDARTRYMGRELRDRQLGVIGLGGIGRELVRLLHSFGMQPPVAFDPALPPHVFAELGVRPVSLQELLQTSDFVSIHCPLNAHTRNLIGAAELQLMKPEACLLNTARGGIVDEDALFNALQNNQIAGAALDCFAEEPVIQPSRFAQLDNVLLAPHSIAWTEELFRDIGHTACSGILGLSLGQRPHGILNPVLFDRASFRKKWSRWMA